MRSAGRDLAENRFWRDPRTSSRIISGAGVFLAFVVSLAVSQVLLERLGAHLFVVALAGIFFGSLYAFVSFRNLMVPLMVWVLAVGGFRFLVAIRTPILPDLFLDRLLMIWLLGVFMVKFVAEGRRFRGPFTLDLVMAAFALYQLARIFIQDSIFLNPWTQSTLIPYGAYFFTKNIITDRKRIHVLMVVFIILLFYYDVTAVAEKFHITWLIWPKTIIYNKEHFFGRSVGPFIQAPLFGTIIGMMLPMHLYFIARARNPMVKIFFMLAMGLGFAGLYFTYTRGSWLAGIMALAAASAFSVRLYFRQLIPLMIIAPIVAVGFLGLQQDTFMQERLENEDTLGSRVGTAVTALRIFRDHPILGVGYFHFRQAREDYIEPVDVPGLGTVRFTQFRHNHIHDIYLGPLAENGLVGFFLQGTIYFLIIREVFRKYRLRNRGDPFAIYFLPIFAGIFVGYWVGGLAIDYRFFAFVDTLFFMSAGILFGYRGEEMEHVS